MNKFSIYILLILIFLGISRSFSPSAQGTKYIINEKVYSNFFEGAPLSLILLDSFQTGFLIKTYYQKYKVVHAFKRPSVVIVRTSYDFWEKNKPNRGMSLFRRNERNNIENNIVLPPGSLYIGDLGFGHWEWGDSGEKFWIFHRAYRHFPKMFGWGEYVPTQDFYKLMKSSLSEEKPFYGIGNEFGTDGPITKKNYYTSINESPKDTIKFKDYIKKFIRNPWKKSKI
jgi:hypothetical protein